MRVVGGQFRGRPIKAPDSGGTRPTSDRVREAVFNILEHGIDHFDISGRRVLDLFAGTGALGIEAISRGASFAMFIEDDADARGVIRENVEAFGLNGVAKIFRRDATGLGDAGKYGGFGLVFADPPYGKGLAGRALASAVAGGWVEPGAVAVVEERSGEDVEIPSSFEIVDKRSWGDTQVIFARYGGGSSAVGT